MEDNQEQPVYTTIEAPVNDAMKNILSQPNVTGVLISDKEGLCVGVEGTIHPSNSGRFTNIFEAALKMAPEHSIEHEGEILHVPDQPIVIIDTDKGSLLTSFLDGFCTTIAKKAE